MKTFVNVILLNFVFLFVLFTAIMFFGCATPKKSESLQPVSLQFFSTTSLREQGEMLLSESKLPAPIPTKVTNLDSEDIAILNSKGYFNSVYFDFDKSNLDNEDKTIIRNIINQIIDLECNNFDDLFLYFSGHCDERGTVEYNLGLGQKRVDNVSQVFKNFLSEMKIKTESFGKEFASSDPKDYANDRRVDIYLK